MLQEENDELLSALHRGVREVYRDDFLWVLDKPSGVLSHPNPGGSSSGRRKETKGKLRARPALLRGDYDFEREVYELPLSGRRPRRVHLIHRLDQETSGLILCAFKEEAAASLKEALFHHEVKKEYRALVMGIPSPARGTWSDCLEKSSRQGRATVIARPGKPNAITRYAVLERYERPFFSLLGLWPETGRTHQLRVQAALRGHFIAGDDRYGHFATNRFLAAETSLMRMFLHSYRLELRHPATAHVLKLEAPLPPRLLHPLQKMESLLKRPPGP